MHQAYPYCTSLWCLRIEKHHPVPPGSVGYLNITNTVHQANLIVPVYIVPVSKSTTQFQLAQSSYRIAPLSTTWRFPQNKLVFPSTKFWAIRSSCTTDYTLTCVFIRVIITKINDNRFYDTSIYTVFFAVFNFNLDHMFFCFCPHIFCNFSESSIRELFLHLLIGRWYCF